MLATLRICKDCGTLITGKTKRGNHLCTWCGSTFTKLLPEENEQFRKRLKDNTIEQKLLPKSTVKRVRVKKGR